MTLQEVAGIDEIEDGRMKHVEAGGREILLASVGGKIYAIEDRCGHMSAPLSMGRLEGKIVQCPLHFARFDVTTGKCVGKPQIGGIEGKILSVTKYSKIVNAIRTRNRETFRVVVEDKHVKLEL